MAALSSQSPLHVLQSRTDTTDLVLTCTEACHLQELKDAYGIVFSRLFALNNMPIKRYVDYLRRHRKLEQYMQLLVDSFNPRAAEVRVLIQSGVSTGSRNMVGSRWTDVGLRLSWPRRTGQW